MKKYLILLICISFCSWAMKPEVAEGTISFLTAEIEKRISEKASESTITVRGWIEKEYKKVCAKKSTDPNNTIKKLYPLYNRFLELELLEEAWE